jgi:hypothetical protein
MIRGNKVLSQVEERLEVEEWYDLPLPKVHQQPIQLITISLPGRLQVLVSQVKAALVISGAAERAAQSHQASP